MRKRLLSHLQLRKTFAYEHIIDHKFKRTINSNNNVEQQIFLYYLKP